MRKNAAHAEVRKKKKVLVEFNHSITLTKIHDHEIEARVRVLLWSNWAKKEREIEVRTTGSSALLRRK
jgi:hypothetical protein